MSTKGHAIRWFAVADGERYPRTAHMRDADQTGWDARCACGWDSQTGGAIAAEIRRKIAAHKYEETGETIYLYKSLGIA